VVTYLALRNGERSVAAMTTALLSEIHARVQTRAQSLMQEAYRANKASRAAIDAGYLSLGQDDRWLQHFWRQKDQFPTVSYFTVGNRHGEWVGLQTHAHLQWHATEHSKGLNTYAVTASGARGRRIYRVAPYDALALDWYRLPLKLRRPAWTPIYVWQHPRVLSMTLSEPLLDSDGEFMGLIAADLSLGEIRDYLMTVRVGKTGGIFLLERDGNLVAASADPQPFLQSRDAPQRIRAMDYSDATVARTSVNLEQRFGTLNKILGREFIQFDNGQQAEHVLVSPFGGLLGLDWLLVVVVPEADFMGEIYAGTRQTVMICMGILVTTVLFGTIFSTRISKPMRTLTERVQQVQAFKLDNNFDVRSIIAEIWSLANALARMQVGLSSFRRFVPDDLVRRILELGEEARLGGETRDVTILFSDLKGYSTLTENLAPETVIQFMNRYFQAMEAVISDHGGVMLELLGDGILAVFGAPDLLPDHATAAIRCAIAMREQLQILNESRYDDIDGFNAPLELYHRIGIHTGRVVAGNIGGQSYMKYGVIGDVVNVAARLEQLNKEYDTSILMSSEVYHALPDDLQARAVDRGATRIKGRGQPQRVYSLSSFDHD
jgi:class 3 adenylate cyclase